MILECPHCNARLNAGSLAAPDKPVRCSKCKQIFQPNVATETPPEPVEPQAFPLNDDASDWSRMASGPADAEETQKPSRSLPASKKEASGKKFPAVLVIGGGVGLLAVVVALIVVFSGNKKPAGASTETVATVQTPPGPSSTQPKKDSPAKTTPAPKTAPNTPPVKQQIPAEYAEIFKETVDRPPPVAQVPILKRVGAEQFPTLGFSNKNTPDPNTGKMSIEEVVDAVKKATTYIENRFPDGGGGTGSGFVIQADKTGILIATNFHVVGDQKTGGLVNGAKLTVVFNSGVPGEKAARGEVLVADPEVDLAIVKVPAIDPLPTRIDPGSTAKLVETMDVRCFGFPFGARLSVSGGRPNVAITKASISSLRLNAVGKLTFVEINGGLNPGNSGGPVVDNNGRLVGIVVSGIPGTGISNAIPAAELNALLSGRVFPPSILPAGEEAGQALFQVDVPVSDPQHLIKEVALHLWTGEEEPKAEKSASGAWKVLPGATRIPLSLTTKNASGTFKLPAPAANTKPTVILQIESVTQNGFSGVTAPVHHQLVLDGVQTANDAVPLETFQQNLAKYAGQVVVVRGKLSPGSLKRGRIYELQIADESGKFPDGLIFVADRDVVTQISELPAMERALEVRLTLRVAKQPTNGNTAARITRIDFIGRGNRLVKSLPSTVEPTDKLIALNRAPEKFIGQSVTFTALLSTSVLGSDTAPELSIMFMSEQRPENLHFSATPEIAKQLKSMGASAKPGTIELHQARMTVHVEPRILEGTTAQVVTVTRMEVAEQGGKTRVIE